MRRGWLHFLLAAASVFAGGCSAADIQISSEPPGVRVTNQEGRLLGETPLTVPNVAGTTLVFDLEGYLPMGYTIQPHSPANLKVGLDPARFKTASKPK